MLTFNATQSTIASADFKLISWLFEVRSTSATNYWSTKNITYDGQDYTFKILANSFSNVKMNRGKSEYSIQAPNDIVFSVSDKDSALTASDFEDRAVLVKLLMNDGTNEAVMRQWKFNTKRCDASYQKLTFTCEDFIQKHLDGDWPNKAVVKTLAPSDEGTREDNLCVPEIYGTAYLPLRSIWIEDQSDRYYVLGESGDTYSIYEVHSPHDYPNQSTWASDSYSFTQSTDTLQGTEWQLFQPIIMDADSDGTADACGVWEEGDYFGDMPTKFQKSSTATATNPTSWVNYILRSFGAPATDITSFSSSYASFNTWGLTFNGGYVVPEEKDKVLSSLLVQCHSRLRITNEIELVILSKTSQKTITKADVLRNSQTGEGTFKYSTVSKEDSDSGYLTFQEADKPQDKLVRAGPIPAKSNTNNISKETVGIPFVQDDQDVQRIATLYFQRKFLRKATVTFTGKSSLLALEPDDVITIDAVDYGGTYNVLIESMQINKDCSIQFTCTRFEENLNDWQDLSPSAIIISEDGTTYTWAPVVTGPDATVSTGDIPNKLRGRLRVGTTGNYILLDPQEPIQKFVEDGVTRFKLGDLGTNDYGLEILDHGGNSIFKLDGSGVNTFSGFTVHSSDGLFSGSGGSQVQLKAGTGFWCGATTFSDAPFSAATDGTIKATQGTIGGWNIGTNSLSKGGIDINSQQTYIRTTAGSNYLEIGPNGLLGYDDVLGWTIKIPTDGSAPRFASGTIASVTYEVYESSIFKTSGAPTADGGFIINSVHQIAYNSSGATTFEVIFDGSDEGDLRIGNYESGGQGIFYDHSDSSFKIRGEIIITGGSGFATPGQSGDSLVALPSDENLKGYWSFDEGYGSTVYDRSGNGFIGTLATSMTNGDWVAGVSGYCLDFDGVDDYVDCGNNATFDFTSEDFSISCWVYFNNFDSPSYIVGRGDQDVAGWSLTLSETYERLVFDTNDATYSTATRQRTVTANNSLASNIWTHIAVVRAGTSAKIYINGEDATYASPDGPHINPASFSSPLLIGDVYEHTGGFSFDGKIDEVRIYQQALAADEVKALYLYPGGNWQYQTGITTFAQVATPTSLRIGDLWIDTDDANKLYRAACAGADEVTAGEWELVRDTDISAAISSAASAILYAASAATDAALAQATADGKIETFYQSDQPGSAATGDLWIDTDDDRLYRYNGSSWDEIQDSDIAQAIADAATAQTTADGKIVTFYQASTPDSNLGTGDLWFDTDDDYKLWRYSGSTWSTARDSGIDQAVSDAAAAITYAASAATDAALAQATADGKVVTYYQSDQPGSAATGDLWIDTDDDRLYRYNGSSWDEIQDADIAQAIADAATAQTTADGKIVTFYQDGVPATGATGDLWFDTDDNNKLYRAAGTADEIKDGEWEEVILPQSALPSNENLIGYWPMDEGSGSVVKNMVQGGADGGLESSMGESNWANGIVGKCVEFDGPPSNHSVNCGKSPVYDFTTESFSVSVWAYLGTPDGNVRILSKGGYGYLTGWELIYVNSLRYFSLRTYDGNFYNLQTTAGSVASHTWYHIVAVKDGVDSKIYLNGISDTYASAVASTISTATSRDLYIGDYSYSPGGGFEWPGKLDEVRIYEQALTADEAKALYLYPAGSQPTTIVGAFPSNENLKAHWSFNDGRGTTLTDVTGNGFDGDLLGSMTDSDWVNGITGKCLEFDGSDDRVDCGTNATFDFTTEDYSVSLWFYINSFTDSNPMLIERYTTQTSGWGIYIQDTEGRIRIHHCQSGNNDYCLTADNSITTGQWYHLVATRSGTIAKLYLNGQDATYYSESLCTPDTHSGNLYIGGYNASNSLSGKIDEVRIYEQCLTAQEALALYLYPGGVPGQKIPTTNVVLRPTAPSGDGLYLGSDYMGFYESSVWKTFWDDSGNFYCGGTASGKLQWDAGANTLTISGAITIESGSGIGNLSDAGTLSTLDEVDVSELASGALARMFQSSAYKTNMEAWLTDTTKINGTYIYPGSIYLASFYSQGLVEEGMKTHNLVINPSFEYGNLFWLDNVYTTFSTAGGGYNSNGYVIVETTDGTAQPTYQRDETDSNNIYIEVNEGETYKGWVDAKTWGTATAELRFYRYDADKSIINRVLIDSTTSQTWTGLSGTYTVATPCKYLRPALRATNATGHVAFDNLVVKKVDTMDDVQEGSTYGRILSTCISAGYIDLSSTFVGSLPVGYTDAKCTDPFADMSPQMPNDSILYGYWPGDASSNSTHVIDLSYYGNHGVISGSSFEWAQGVSGSCLELDGDNTTYLNCGNDPPLDEIGDGSFTVSCWFKVIGTPNAYATLMEKRQSGTDRMWLRRASSSDYLQFLLEADDDIEHSYFYDTTGWDDGEWHHIAVVVNRTTNLTTCYFDGTQSAYHGDISNITGNLANTGDVLWGRVGHTANYGWSGRIDEMRIYDGALTEAQCKALYYYPGAQKGNWISNVGLQMVPAAPSGDGLFLGADYLGYYGSGQWQTYMDSSGNFYLGGSQGSLQWNAGSDILAIRGTVDITGSSTISQVLTIESGGLIRTAEADTYPRVEITSSGIQLKDSDAVATYGTGKCGHTDMTYGGGCLVWLMSDSYYIPYVELKEPTDGSSNPMASIRLYDRSSDPTGGSYGDGDLCCVNGYLKIYRSGSWATVDDN